MGCQKCTTTPILPNDLKRIIVVANHEYMLAKLYNNFNSKFELIQNNEYIEVKEDCEKFILAIANSKIFSQVELENMSILILDINEVPTFRSYNKLKSLNYWITLYSSKDLKWILDNQSIVTYFQPIFDVKSGDIYAYECLSRGIREDGTIMPPNIMFESAKKTEMLFNLDRQCRLISLTNAKRKGITKNLFINFMPTAIYNPEFCLRDTLKTAKELDYDFNKIIFEVVETEHVENIEHLKTIFDYYLEIGFRVALDDVGAGYSSLNMLAVLKPNFIKIDMELIRNIHNDSAKRAIVSSLCSISKEIGVITLAEGIETLEEFNVIKELGVELAQGYLLGKPSKDI
ncbi:MAG: EAL domain-containing protein [Dissulfuribacterales bacterium]